MSETAQPQAGTANQPEEINAQNGFFKTEAAGDTGSETPASENPVIPDEPYLTVRYNKEDKPLSKEEAVVYAQKGMNYDKLSERLKELSARLGGQENDSEDTDVLSEVQKQDIIDSQLDCFMRENPGVDPRSLPESVIGEWKKGMPLSEAFLRHQTDELSAKIRDMQEAAAKSETNRKNETASMGRASEGAARMKAINEENIRNMTPEELDRNHERIWAFLTGR